MARIQLSISETDTAPDLLSTHLAIARALLQAGHTLAYGGDLRALGFARPLFELVGELRTQGQRVDAVHSHIAWPLAGLYDDDTWRALDGLAVPHTLPRPADPLLHDPSLPWQPDGDDAQAKAARGFFPPDTAARRYAWSVGLSEMRRSIHDPTLDRSAAADKRPVDATLLLGGKVAGFAGTVPGVLEELVVAREHGTPVFLCGGFGGVGELAAQVLEHGGEGLAALDEREEVHRWAGDKDRSRRTSELIGWLRAQRGFRGALGEHLTDQEHRRLAWTTSPTEIAASLVAGL